MYLLVQMAASCPYLQKKVKDFCHMTLVGGGEGIAHHKDFYHIS